VSLAVSSITAPGIRLAREGKIVGIFPGALLHGST